MKTIGIIALSVFLINCSVSKNKRQMETNPEKKKITLLIKNFSKAGDDNSVEELDKLLDNNYRVVMNRLFGSNKVSVLSKEQYLNKIETKVFGGDKRTIEFEDIILNGSTAVAKVVFKGEKATFNSLMTLVQDETGRWKLVSDMPTIK